MHSKCNSPNVCLMSPLTIMHFKFIPNQPCHPFSEMTTVEQYLSMDEWHTVYPKKYAHGFCFAVLCCGYTLTDFPISIRLTSLVLWQSNDCPSASKATLMNMDKYFMWIHYERLHNHNKAKHNKTVCIFLGIYCITHDTHGGHHGEHLKAWWHDVFSHHGDHFLVTSANIWMTQITSPILY